MHPIFTYKNIPLRHFLIIYHRNEYSLFLCVDAIIDAIGVICVP